MEEARQEIAIQSILDRIKEEEKKAEIESAKKAKYKIQIWFKSKRSLYNPMVYTISLWESGKRLHGGGDEMMFICRRHAGSSALTNLDVAPDSAGFRLKPGPRGCGRAIPGELSTFGTVVCPHCGSKHQTDEIGDSVVYKTTAQVCAKILYDWWIRLDSNADIYAKYRPDDPRTLMMSRAWNATVARQKKGLSIYPLRNIIADTSNGSSVPDRFKAFITA